MEILTLAISIIILNGQIIIQIFLTAAITSITQSFHYTYQHTIKHGINLEIIQIAHSTIIRGISP
jgi:hypothetical protein